MAHGLTMCGAQPAIRRSSCIHVCRQTWDVEHIQRLVVDAVVKPFSGIKHAAAADTLRREVDAIISSVLLPAVPGSEAASPGPRVADADQLKRIVTLTCKFLHAITARGAASGATRNLKFNHWHTVRDTLARALEAMKRLYREMNPIVCVHHARERIVLAGA